MISFIFLFFGTFARAEEFIWPLPHADGLDHPHIGANFPQAQKVEDHYFHAGLDLMAPHGTEIVASVSGYVEAGYYQYEDQPNGHYYALKSYVPFRESVSSPHGKGIHPFRFEVAIIDNNGFRHEYHHVDPNSLSIAMRGKILRRSRVQQGDVIGRVIGVSQFEPGNHYDHIHYNVTSPDGIHLNPLQYTLPVEDSLSPEILGAYYSLEEACPTGSGGRFKPVVNDQVPLGSQMILVKAEDRIPNNPFSLGLHKIRVFYEKIPEGSYAYDFSRLLLANGFPADYQRIFQSDFCLDTGLEAPEPFPGTTSREFYHKVPVPNGYKGKVQVVLEDFAGNQTHRHFMVQ